MSYSRYTLGYSLTEYRNGEMLHADVAAPLFEVEELVSMGFRKEVLELLDAKWGHVATRTNGDSTWDVRLHRVLASACL